MTSDFADFLEFTVETAYLAGRLTLGYFQAGVQVDYKPDDSPVTVADRQAEELIRRRIEQKFPGHSILGEEGGGQESPASGFRWIIDPIDGTKSFMRGVPLYAVLVGLEIEGRVEVGAACFPALNEIVYAATGLGCWWNGRRARVSQVQHLSRAIIAATSAGGFRRAGRQAAWERIQAASYYQPGWGDAYGYALVATGRAEVMLDPVMNIWDCGPFPPILSQAGGFFGDWQGSPTIYTREALATSQALLPEVLEILRGETRDEGYQQEKGG